jgi:arylsulfatase A-like enzyme
LTSSPRISPKIPSPCSSQDIPLVTEWLPENIDRDGLRYDFWAGWQYHGNYWHDRDCPNITNNGVENKTQNHCTCPLQGELPRVGHEGIEHPIHTTTEMVPQKVRQFLDSRDPSAPFCLTVGFKAPKDPWDDFPENLADLYRGVDMPIPATATPEAAAALPEFLRKSLASDAGLRYAEHHDELAERIRYYYRCVTALDDAVGQMRATLDEHGVANNTVIIFMSDNGHFLADHGLWGKWLGYEPSIRVPGLIYDPRLPTHRRGKRRSEMALNIDVAPTLLSLAGVPVPESMQGADLTPLLEGRRVPWREDWFFEHTWDAEGRIEPSEGIRTKRWKYLRYTRQEPAFEQLFDLGSDPIETRDLAGKEDVRPVLEHLRGRWEAFRQTLVE